MSAWIQALAATAGFVFLAMQILLERKAKRFEIYEHIGGRFTELLWREADDEALQDIWEPLPAQEDARLREAHASGSTRYGAWDVMTPAQKRAHSYTRSALEILEQANEAKQRRLVPRDVSEKWDRWLLEWAQTRYVPYVLRDDADPMSPFQADFAREVWRLRKAS
jgi:hypothetical protein